MVSIQAQSRLIYFGQHGWDCEPGTFPALDISIDSYYVQSETALSGGAGVGITRGGLRDLARKLRRQFTASTLPHRWQMALR